MPFLIVEAFVPVKYSRVCEYQVCGGCHFPLPPWPRDLATTRVLICNPAIQLAS